MKEYENGVYRMDGLRSGLYIVKETKAPEGFLMDENSYAFSITEDASNHYVLKIAGKRYNPNELGRILAGMELH